MKKINLIDVVIFAAIAIALTVGYFTYKHYRQTAGNRIESTAKIGFQVYLRGVTLTGNESPIVPGAKTFITIRNVPYTELTVLNSKIDSKKTVVANPANPSAGLIVDDYSQMFMYDIIVTLADTAKITQDGPVVGGNKIKIGLPITLEGPAYKLNGTVSDVRILQEPPADQNKPAPVAVKDGEALQNQQPQPQAPAAPKPLAQPAKLPTPAAK